MRGWRRGFRGAAALAAGIVLAAPALAAVETVTSPGGITAWLVEDHSLPVVTINLGFRGGGALDPPGKAGLAALTMDLLDEGAGTLDSTAYQGREEDLASAISFAAGEDELGISLRTLSANLAPACDLLRLALTAPRFDPAAVARVRGQLIAEVARAEHRPRYIAQTAWWANAFPAHPYGRPLDGTPDTLARITVAEMRQFVQDRIAKDVMMVGVVGDITPARLKRLLDRTFGALPAQAAAGRVPDARAGGAGAVLLAPLAIPQSVVVFGEPGLRRGDRDWYAALLDNYVLGGGGFDSRLMHEVRETRGLAYGVYTALDPRQEAGVLIGDVATENAHVAQVIALIRAQWRRMRDAGPTAQELRDAKTYLTGSFPLSLDSTERMAAVLVAIQRDRLGIDYLDRRSGLIAGVSLADAKRVARRLFDPAALSFVIVGRPAPIAGARQIPVPRSKAPTATAGAPPSPPPLPSAGIGQGLR